MNYINPFYGNALTNDT